MAGVRVHFIFSKDLLDRVDAVRGDLSRGAWVRECVEEALRDKPVPDAVKVGVDLLEQSCGFKHGVDLDDLAPVELSRSELFRRASQR